MAIEVYDPQGLIPWRLHTPLLGQPRRMLIVTGRIYVRTTHSDPHTLPALDRLLLTLSWIHAKGEAVPVEPASEGRKFPSPGGGGRGEGETVRQLRLISPPTTTEGSLFPQ